jgi:hypothetical protein
VLILFVEELSTRRVHILGVTAGFDTVIASDRIRVLLIPVRAPRANSYAERCARWHDSRLFAGRVTRR